MILRDNRVKFIQNSIIEKFKPYKDYLSNYEEFISAVKSTNTLEEVLEFNQLRFHLSYLTFQKLLDSRLSDYNLTLNDFVKFTENNLELTEKEWVEIREQARREVALESYPEYQLKLAKETINDDTSKKFASAVRESTTEADSLLLNMLSLHISNCEEQGLIDETVQGEDIEDTVDFTHYDEYDEISESYEEELEEELEEAQLDFSFLGSDSSELDGEFNEELDDEDLDFSSEDNDADEDLDGGYLDFSSDDSDVDEDEYLVESGIDFTEDDGIFESEDCDYEDDQYDIEDDDEMFDIDDGEDFEDEFETSEDFEDENEYFEEYSDDFKDSDNDFENDFENEFETSEDFEDENEDFEGSDNYFSEESNEDWDFDQAEDVYKSNVGLYGGSGGYDSAGLSQKEILLGEERKREKKPLSQETIFLQRQQRDELADERAEKAQEALNLAIKLVDAPKKLASLFGSKRKKR